MTLSVVSTDHAPFNFHGQKDSARTTSPRSRTGARHRGAPQVLHEFGVRAGKMDLNRMVQLWATNPAKLFGLYPRKGTIAIGSDADIVIFDPAKKATMSVKTHHSTCDYNLFEGTEVTGMPEMLISRGKVIVDGDELTAEAASHGEFIKRSAFNERLSAGRRNGLGLGPRRAGRAAGPALPNLRRNDEHVAPGTDPDAEQARRA